MSRAVVAVAYGGPEVLALVEADPGPPGPGEVLLDVRAAGVNPADWKSYSGVWGTDPARLPVRLGFEVAGVVVAVGPDVASVAVGDEVVAHPVTGAYADRVLVAARVVVPRPTSLAWVEAGGLLLTGSTASHTVTATALGPGDVVLVHGGSGSVGRYAVQLAVLRGAHVIATAGERAHDDLRGLGAVPVTYGPGLGDRIRVAARTTGPVTAAIDTAGTDEALDVSTTLVADRARIVTIAGGSRAGALGIRALGGGPGADPGTAVRAAARGELVALVTAGRLDVPAARPFPLAEAAAAHRESIGGHPGSKLVLVP
jgi:NADPH:quinone reductase-like Zn-dependent oxidoreductase